MTDADRRAILRVLQNATQMVQDGRIRDSYDCGLVANSMRQELEIFADDPNEIHRDFDTACRAGHREYQSERRHSIIVDLMK